jgi:hypothetical protein
LYVQLIARNVGMLSETRDTVTIPGLFMLRVMALARSGLPVPLSTNSCSDRRRQAARDAASNQPVAEPASSSDDEDDLR